ncbi:hypothetical protein ACTXT7_001618 [Hymenolepis weldensis]
MSVFFWIEFDLVSQHSTESMSSSKYVKGKALNEYSNRPRSTQEMDAARFCVATTLRAFSYVRSLHPPQMGVTMAIFASIM